jgi:hypothetical protein
MNPRLPGLPTMATLLLAATLVVWLGISGPIRLSYEVVKDFQPLMAAMIALAAGTLAYWGAMAKVNLDRAELDRRRISEQLGLLLRLRAAVERVSEEAGAKVKLLTFQPSSDATRTSITIIPEQLRIAVPDELTEAWTRLDLFPEASIRQPVGWVEHLRNPSPCCTCLARRADQRNPPYGLNMETRWVSLCSTILRAEPDAFGSRGRLKLHRMDDWIDAKRIERFSHSTTALARLSQLEKPGGE